MKQTIAFSFFMVLPALMVTGGSVTFQIDGEVVQISNTEIKAEQELFSLFKLSLPSDDLGRTRDLLDDDGFISLIITTSAFIRQQSLRSGVQENDLRLFSEQAIEYLRNKAKDYEKQHQQKDIETLKKALNLCLLEWPLNDGLCHSHIDAIKRLQQTPNLFSSLRKDIDELLAKGRALNDGTWFSQIKAVIIEPYMGLFQYSIRKFVTQIMPGYVIGGLGPESYDHPPHIPTITVPVTESLALNRFTFDLGND